MVIIGVKDLTNGLRQVLLLNSLVVIALVELVELEIVNCLGIPDAERVNEMIVVADDRELVGNGHNSLAVLLYEALAALRVLSHANVAAETDQLCIIGVLHLEGIAVLEPVIGNLDLEAVIDLLLEHTVLVADSAADRRITERRERIEEARGQTSETAVAERCIGLFVLYGIKVKAVLVEHFGHNLVSLHVNEDIAQGTSHQELHGHVVNSLCLLLAHSLMGSNPVIDDVFLHGVADALEHLLLRSVRGLLAEQCHEVIFDGSL